MKTLILTIFTMFALCSCTSDAPRQTKINGHTLVQTDKRFLGVKVCTSERTIQTKDQKLEDLEISKVEREQELDLKAEERQSAAAFWGGVILLAIAPVFVLIGYISSGWKFWGGLSATSAALGAAFWSFEHLIPYLQWPAFGLGGAVVLWTMWRLKGFSLRSKLKDSAPGKLL